MPRYPHPQQGYYQPQQQQYYPQQQQQQQWGSYPGYGQPQMGYQPYPGYGQQYPQYQQPHQQQQQQIRPPHQNQAIVVENQQPPKQHGSRSNSMERQRNRNYSSPPQHQQQQQRPIRVDIPNDMGMQQQRPQQYSSGSTPRSPRSPRGRGEFREAMEQPMNSPPPRQLFELPWDPKTDPNPRPDIRHVHANELVSPEVLKMYAGHGKSSHHSDPTLDGRDDRQQNFSRSGSLRRSQQGTARRSEQPPNADLAKNHLSMSNSREHLGPGFKKKQQQQQQQQQQQMRPSVPSKPDHLQRHRQQESVQLVRHIPPEEAAQIPQAMFEEKPKWKPMRPEKFSIFGKEAAYPPFPVIGPSYMLSISGGAKLIEIVSFFLIFYNNCQ